MQLKEYDIAVIISEPGLDLEDQEATTTLTMTIRQVSREALLKHGVSHLFKNLVEAFEETLDSVVDLPEEK